MSRFELLLHPYDLPLSASWPGRSAPLERRRGWILEVRGKGTRGFGECAPLPQAGTEDMTAAAAALEALAVLSYRNSEALRAELEALPRELPAVACGLETALLDLESRGQGLPLRTLLTASAADSFLVNSLSGSACRNGALSATGAGFTVIKLKLGHRDWEEEARCLKLLARRLPAGVRLRLDANGSWPLPAAQAFLEAVAPLPVDCVEEPLRHPTLGMLAELQAETAIPLAVDESLHRLGREELLRAAPVHRLALKPMALGGPMSTLELARQALERGMLPIITSSLESAVGIHALCQLAAALEPIMPGNHHGLATSDWFRNNTAPAPRLEQGRILLDQRPGIGVIP
jgi:o-succinylbenzoate synthase